MNRFQIFCLMIVAIAVVRIADLNGLIHLPQEAHGWLSFLIFVFALAMFFDVPRIRRNRRR